MDYQEFLLHKQIKDKPSGFTVSENDLNQALFPFQKALVKWSIARGRAALFEGTGLGKTIQQLDWARLIYRHTKAPVLILAPLAVSEQTVQEGKKFGIKSKVVQSQDDVWNGVNVTNYEKLHKFDPSAFAGVVLDESSILKSFSGTTRNQIIQAFKETPYRLSCTATPAPNDYTELGNQAEFLGIMTHSEMRSTFFINDTGDTGKWRLKGHAKDNVFWSWLASWGAVVNMPQDLGFDNGGFDLPPINYHEHILSAPKGAKRRGFFLVQVTDLNDRRRVRKETIETRCKAAADLINSTDDRWLIWCNLNDEGTLLAKLIDEAVEVAGRHDNETKAERLLEFASGKIRRLVSKPEIAGWGMNFQVCHKAVFVGLNDSWESLFQATRRIWRFGQQQPVDIHIIVEEREGPVLQNIKRKDEQSRAMAAYMTEHMRDLVKKEVLQAYKETDSYEPKMKMEIPTWMTT